MTELHQKIVTELVKEYTTDSNTIGITLFGSVSAGQNRTNSDIDIEIITVKPGFREESMQYMRDGIKVDLHISSKEFYQHMTYDYPYLWYDYAVRHKVLYDPTNLVQESLTFLESYLASHPAVVAYWKQIMQELAETKSQGIPPRRDTVEIYTEAEQLFSDSKQVTRDFFI